MSLTPIVAPANAPPLVGPDDHVALAGLGPAHDVVLVDRKAGAGVDREAVVLPEAAHRLVAHQQHHERAFCAARLGAERERAETEEGGAMEKVGQSFLTTSARVHRAQAHGSIARIDHDDVSEGLWRRRTLAHDHRAGDLTSLR